VAAAGRGGPNALAALASTRRAIELDRFGIAAHVLAVRDGCTAEKCAAFAMLQDAATLKANFKAHAFDAYVARYATAWGKGEAAPENSPAASYPGTAPVAFGSGPPFPTPSPRGPFLFSIFGVVSPRQHHECGAADPKGAGEPSGCSRGYRKNRRNPACAT